jgi:hypothetical protein
MGEKASLGLAEALRVGGKKYFHASTRAAGENVCNSQFCGKRPPPVHSGKTSTN